MTDTPIPETPRFASLFKGLDRAYGTGKGQWIHEPLKLAQYAEHLHGRGPGLGVAPLKDDGKVHFAAIDLDEPNFTAAQDMAGLLPGPTFIERSRSGNAHVWAFFSDPDGVEAWVVRGILRAATEAVGLPRVEVFPKQDKLRAGMVGSYINLPYFGSDRPMLYWDDDEVGEHSLRDFIALAAGGNLNDADTWRKRARYLGVESPEARVRSNDGRPFGEQPYLHICAEHIIENRDSNPIREGHRALVYFNLAKQLANCSLFDDDEAMELLTLVNEASPDAISESELRRFYNNAVRGEYTSTGCDDPLFAPYAHPDCPIAGR